LAVSIAQLWITFKVVLYLFIPCYTFYIIRNFFIFMQWNDIRNRLKKTVPVMNDKNQDVSMTASTPVDTIEPVLKSQKVVKPLPIILILGLIAIIVVIVLLLQSQKVANVGPAKDMGLTREEARAAQSFLEQAQPEPLSQEEMQQVDTFFKTVEMKKTAPIVPVEKTGTKK
jgi:Sec-independent protein translocase protein TatA